MAPCGSLLYSYAVEWRSEGEGETGRVALWRQQTRTGSTFAIGPSLRFTNFLEYFNVSIRTKLWRIQKKGGTTTIYQKKLGKNTNEMMRQTKNPVNLTSLICQKCTFVWRCHASFFHSFPSPLSTHEGRAILLTHCTVHLISMDFTMEKRTRTK